MVSCATRSGIELWKRYDHNSIYTGYIQGGLGAINLDLEVVKSDPSSALRARRGQRSHKTQFRCIMKTQNDHAILLVDKRWLAT